MGIIYSDMATKLITGEELWNATPDTDDFDKYIKFEKSDPFASSPNPFNWMTTKENL
jgi:hypothetical protein